MRRRVLCVTALISLSSYAVFADVRTEQKSQVQFAGALGRVFNLFGGKSAREGITSTVVVKGNRKVTSTGTTSQIVDLNEEKIYDLDLKKKSYKITTFAELRLKMEEAHRKAAEDARKQEAQAKPDESASNGKEVEVDFDLKNTGHSKTINGFDTSQSIMTITVREKGKTLEQGGGLVMTSDMWLAPDQPAMREVAEFDRRYAEKLYSGVSGMSADQMAMAIAFYPMLRQAVTRMAAEGAKIKGTPIATTLTFDAVKSEEQMTADAKQEQPEAKPSGLGGMLGGLAKKVRKNEDDKPQPRTTFMTTNLEVLNLSTDVAAEAVAIPAGFKESK
jgi:hypothetical protein